jgi:hypothetical protein
MVSHDGTSYHTFFLQNAKIKNQNLIIKQLENSVLKFKL